MILLDTHVALWILNSPEELSTLAMEAIQQERSRGELVIAARSLWEMADLIQRGRIWVDVSVGTFLRDIERNFAMLHLTAAIAEQSVRFSRTFPKDPSDRVIAATALIHGVSLITKDAAIRRSGEVSCIW